MENSQNPIFPLEIFARIIEKASECPAPPTDLTEEQRATLGAFGLTCRSILQLSRRETFRRVSISFYVGGGEKLLRLMDVLEAEPHIKDYIKEVRISLLAVRPRPEPYERLRSRGEHPSNFPAVQSLSIVDGYFHTVGGRAMHRPSRVPGWLQDFCQVIINSYISLPTLQSLYFEDNTRTRNLPYLALGCPTVTHLKLVNVRNSPNPELSEFVLPPFDNLKCLTMDTCESAFLPILSKSTSVSELTLQGSFKELKTLPIPTFNLTALALVPDERRDDGLFGSLDLLWRDNRLGLKPISWLKDFYVGILVPGDLAIINSMFKDLWHLQSLAIDVLLSKEDPSFSFANLSLDKHLNSSSPLLTTLSISFWHYTDTGVIASFIDTLSSISVAKSLRHLKLKISLWTCRLIEDEDEGGEITYSDMGLPLHDDILFPSLAAIVSRVLGFELEQLEELSVDINFCVRSYTNDEPKGTMLQDDIFLPKLRGEILEFEQQNGVRLHPVFTSPVTTSSSWRRPCVTSRSAILTLYPKQHYIGPRVQKYDGVWL